MQASRDMGSVTPLLLTAMIIAGLTSAIGWVLWQHHDEQRAATISRLEQELQRAEMARQRLDDRLSASQKGRHDQVTELQRLASKLERTREQLAKREAQNWPERYADLEEKNYELSEQIHELKLRHSIAQDKLAADYEALQTAHQQLQQSHAELEAAYSALEQQLASARQAVDEARARITDLEQQLAQSESFAVAEITTLQTSLAAANAARQTGNLWRDTLARDLIESEIESDRRTARIETLATARRHLQTQLAASEEQLRLLRERNKALTAELKAARQ